LKSAAYESQQVMKQLTMREAFDSSMYAVYVGTTKQRLVGMTEFLGMKNKLGHDEWLRLVYIFCIIASINVG
jgi:hypothetical protein